jgi:anti-sigma B factor antagonist
LGAVGEAEEQYLSVTTDPDGSVVVSGEVDLYTAPMLERAVESVVKRGEGNLVIDLAAVRFMDSAGLNVLIRAFKPLDAQGRRVVLRSPQESVRRTLELGGIVTLVDLEG